jgi:hypothetical protein
MSSVMPAPLSDVAMIVRHNNKVAAARTRDFSAADWDAQFAGGSSARWVVGHLCNYRRRQIRMLGAPSPDAPWDAAFAKDTTPGSLPAHPDGPAALAEFSRLGEELATLLEKVTPETAVSATGQTLFNGATTVSATATTWLWHECYHIGQLGMLKRYVGK